MTSSAAFRAEVSARLRRRVKKQCVEQTRASLDVAAQEDVAESTHAVEELEVLKRAGNAEPRYFVRLFLRESPGH